MSIKYTEPKVIDVSDWNDLVTETYGKPYNFQQQDGCKDRGHIHLSIVKEFPDNHYYEDFDNTEIPIKCNGEIMGVSFKTWLETDSLAFEDNFEYDFEEELFWERNFYPKVEMIANDLCKKGLIEEGKYSINIDW